MNMLVLFSFQKLAVYENRIDLDGSNITVRKNKFKSHLHKKIDNKTNYIKKREKTDKNKEEQTTETREEHLDIETNDNGEESSAAKITSELTE